MSDHDLIAVVIGVVVGIVIGGWAVSIFAVWLLVDVLSVPPKSR